MAAGLHSTTGRWLHHADRHAGGRAGAPWRDLPERYGPWQTCYDRLVRWRRDRTWDKLLQHEQTKSDAEGEVVWEVSVDSTTVRAPQHAAGARKRLAKPDQKN